MIYLSQMLGTPVMDAEGKKIGTVNDLGIATGEVFPRVTSLAFEGPEKTPFMISWRKYVDSFAADEVDLKVPAEDIRFSYLQPDEVLIARDLLNKQIVDTRGMKVVRVNDLKLSDTGSSLRLLGAEVGMRGILRSISPKLEAFALKVAKAFGTSIPEQVIAWNYMDLLDRDLSNVKLSVSHKTLDELHPADIADIIEQLDPRLRAQVFAQLDDDQAAEAMAELDDDEVAASIVDDMTEADASKMLSEMDPDDAADLVSELGHEKAEKLLRLMGVNERRAIDQLLGYRDDTAGRIMTSEFVSMPERGTIGDAVERIRGLDEDFETVYYVYTTDDKGRLSGVVTLHELVVEQPDVVLADVAHEATATVGPDDDQEDVAETMNKYNLLSIPVIDDKRKILGIVTIDDAFDVLEEEHEEDLQIAGAHTSDASSDESGHVLMRLLSSEMWLFFWVVGFAVLLVASALVCGDITPGLLFGIALPAALHAADTMVRHVTNFFLEYDEDDEDAPSMLGFALRGIGASVVYAGLMLALVAVADAVLSASSPIGADGASALLGRPLSASFLVAAATIVVAFALAPAFLAALRSRDRAGKDMSGQAMRGVALALATVVFVAVALAVICAGTVA
ncbi:MAG: CBS domain-containing protein [Atopobiaceae bacterium]|nr:CBS domain-containing protein [Atopobiaceae bacterium]MCH4120164.1 CBS domain-containing protein [Atopobiaceae bacterium]MCI1319034.1 CBS domain-containing protein [Atopobiaceae bacterium]MCI1389233.1 CBS domain-containing protein [Atopobiaceae bacterium]MCI1432756.1 CBS domain-containing protein [Atopobiaceae bacterium]